MLGELRSRLQRLRECCLPFSVLSSERAQEAIDSLRVYELAPGESLSLLASKRPDSLYVVEGEVDLVKAAGAPVRHAALGADPAPIALGPGDPPLALTAVSPALVARADGEVLDYLTSWEAVSAGLGTETDQVPARLGAIRHALAFRRLPLESVEEAFRRMRPIALVAGTDVVRQGEPGDAFYVIQSGRAEVWRTGLYDDEPRKVDEMGPGEAFGEEALLLGGARGATVRMVEDGTLLVMNKADFDDVIRQPMIEQFEAPIAKACLEAGYVPLDVRYDEEYAEGHLPGAALIPLPELRRRWQELDPAKKYLVYCKSGARSAVGTLLLRQRNLQAVSLANGLRAWPYGTVSD